MIEAGLVIEQWGKSNSKFVHPVTIAKKRSVIKNGLSLVEAVDGRTKVRVKQQRIDELDKIFDIMWCKHQILPCKH